MAGWTVKLDRGDEILTLDTNIRFEPNVDKKLDNEGNVESTEWQLVIHGTVRSDTPATVAQTIADYLEHVWDKHTDVTVTLERDGTEYVRLEPEDAFIGPHITGFSAHSSQEGGTGESMWRFTFTVQARMKGVQTSGDDPVYELHSSIATTKKDGEVIRKVWKIDAQSTSTEAALGIVKAFGPGSTKTITEETEPRFQDARASGVWVWERETKNGILRHRCNVRASGGRTGYVPVGVAGAGKDAVLFQKQRTPLRLVVDGEIIAARADLVPPKAHFTESATMFRATEEEMGYRDVEIHDEQRGEYRLIYQEVWYSIGPTGAPDHSGHNVIEKPNAPSD